MIDKKIVQDKYASMADAQLIYFGRNDSHDLTSEAMDLLKQEFARRNMNIADFLPQKTEPEPLDDDEREDIPISNNPQHDIISGFPYEQIIASPQEERSESDQINAASVKEEDLQGLIHKCDRSMVINGIIFFIGFAVTLYTFMDAQDKGGSVIVAWGAILFGGFAVVRAYFEKRQLQSVLRELVANKENEPSTENK